jgi:hypothetical protein
VNLSSVWTRWVAPLAAAGGCLLVLDGCLVYRAVTAPVKLVATTVVVAGEAAGAVVTATGRVAVSAVKAVGSVGGGGIDAAGKLAQAGMVTFVDATTGTLVRVPWQEGLTLARAGDAARISLVQRAIDVVRAGRVIFSASRGTGEGAPLAAGDVVRLGG